MSKILSVVLGLVLLASVGCSPAQQSWAIRGHQGIALAQANQTEWYKLTIGELAKARRNSIEASFADTKLVLAHGIPATASQPTTRPIDETWLKAQQMVLVATLDAYDKQKDDITTKYQIAMKNLASTDEAFTEIQRLNVAWANDANALAAQVAQLTALVQAMAAKGGQ